MFPMDTKKWRKLVGRGIDFTLSQEVFFFFTNVYLNDTIPTIIELIEINEITVTYC